MSTLKAELQSMYKGPDSSSGGVRILDVRQNADGTVNYLTSQCDLRYLRNGRACMHTVTTYSVVVRAFKAAGHWQTDEANRDCRYWIKTKREAVAYFKQVNRDIPAWDESVNCQACKDAGEINGSGCVECCEHREHDHFVCLDCGREGEPSDYYDEDYGSDR